jgi:hypothetical protein
MSILVGVQLIIYWVIIQTLDELSQRDLLVASELLLDGTPEDKNGRSSELPTRLTAME